MQESTTKVSRPKKSAVLRVRRLAASSLIERGGGPQPSSGSPDEVLHDTKRLSRQRDPQCISYFLVRGSAHLVRSGLRACLLHLCRESVL
jgi:hypothetical protein